ncbi:MAG: hypothetical protein R6V85_15385 [Polyangia bacterium]
MNTSAQRLFLCLTAALAAAACGASTPEAPAAAGDRIDAGAARTEPDAACDSGVEAPAPDAGPVQARIDSEDEPAFEARCDPFCEAFRPELREKPARAGRSVRCGRIDQLVYYRWKAASRCRDAVRVELHKSGRVTVDRAVPPASGREVCPPLREFSLEIAASEATSLIQLVCRAFEREYSTEVGIGCPAGSRLFEFFDARRKIARTEALPCESELLLEPARALDEMAARAEQSDEREGK